MKKLEIVIRPENLEDIKAILNEHWCGGMTILSAMGCGNQKGDKNTEFKGVKLDINLLPKIQINAVIEDEVLEELLTEIKEKISTGSVGDGKVFVYTLDDVMRIRTGERGSNAI